MPALGKVLEFSSDLYDKPLEEGGVLVNAQSATLTITLPDGTTATPTVTNPPATTGHYECDYQTTLSSPQGRYFGAWLFTFPSGATVPYEESFDVGRGIVSVDEALHYLRAQNVLTSEPDLDLLQWLTFVATNAVELDLGRAIVKQTFTETRDGGDPVIRLKKTPVISVTSVTENGVALSTGDYILRRSNMLQRGTTTSRWCWAGGWENVTVTYVAGYVNPPYIVRQVALAAIQGMWQDSQQADHPSMDEFGAANVRAAVGALTPIEMRAYDALRPVLAA